MKPRVKQKLVYRLPPLRIVGVAAIDTQILVHNNNSVTVQKWFEMIC
jgi:hypothetical protein